MPLTWKINKENFAIKIQKIGKFVNVYYISGMCTRENWTAWHQGRSVEDDFHVHQQQRPGDKGADQHQHIRERRHEQADTQAKVLWNAIQTHNHVAMGMVELNNANNKRAAAE